MSRSKHDTFFLRTSLVTAAGAYVGDEIDIASYIDPTTGIVMIVDRVWATFRTDGAGPILPADVGGAATKSVAVQACSEVKTQLALTTDTSLFFYTTLYAATDAATNFQLMNTTAAMNPADYENGFVVATPQIHVGIDVGSAWAAEVRVGVMFEVHTEKLSLSQVQKVLISLTA